MDLMESLNMILIGIRIMAQGRHMDTTGTEDQMVSQFEVQVCRFHLGHKDVVEVSNDYEHDKNG
jgi:hypothetical protein